LSARVAALHQQRRLLTHVWSSRQAIIERLDLESLPPKEVEIARRTVSDLSSAETASRRAPARGQDFNVKVSAYGDVD